LLVALVHFGVATLIDMVFARFTGVMVRMRRMGVSRMCVMCRSHMISGFPLVRCLAMMPGRLFVVFGSAVMVLSGWVLVIHLILPELKKRSRVRVSLQNAVCDKFL
jgi:hypothetical protein